MDAELESRVAVATRGNHALRAVLEELIGHMEGKGAESGDGPDAHTKIEELKESVAGRFDRVQQRLRALENGTEGE